MVNVPPTDWHNLAYLYTLFYLTTSKWKQQHEDIEHIVATDCSKACLENSCAKNPRTPIRTPWLASREPFLVCSWLCKQHTHDRKEKICYKNFMNNLKPFQNKNWKKKTNYKIVISLQRWNKEHWKQFHRMQKKKKQITGNHNLKDLKILLSLFWLWVVIVCHKICFS